MGAEAAALRGLDALPDLVEVGVEDLAIEAAAAYDRALAAQRSGDWARYGREIERLGELLRQIRERTGSGIDDPS